MIFLQLELVLKTNRPFALFVTHVLTLCFSFRSAFQKEVSTFSFYFIPCHNDNGQSTHSLTYISLQLVYKCCIRGEYEVNIDITGPARFM